jgi:hypothetical protein
VQQFVKGGFVASSKFAERIEQLLEMGLVVFILTMSAGSITHVFLLSR